MPKYGNRKTVVDNITFDSKKEADRYVQLKLLLKAGKIEDLKLQPKYELQPKYKMNGKTVSAITYTPDFEYYEDGIKIVEDVKGFKTRDYILRKKLFEYKYQTPITEI